MKKLILTSTVLLAVTATGFSQGLINILGGTSAATKMSTNSVVGGPATGVTAANTTTPNFYYAIFASSSQSMINGSAAGISGTNGNYVFNNLGGGTPSTGWEFVGIATNYSTGRFVASSQGTTSGNQAALNADGSLSVLGIPGAGTAYIVTVGWEAAGIGNTLAALESWYSLGANGGWIGQSGIATVTLGDGVGVSTPNPFGTTTGQVGGILIGETPSVPEPGSIALAVIGAGSLLMFRRKNK
jgi:hypothetical protein